MGNFLGPPGFRGRRFFGPPPKRAAPPPPSGPSVYADWLGWTLNHAVGDAYAPPLAAIAAGKTGVWLVVIGQSIDSDFPAVPTYGALPATISLTQSSGDCWAFAWGPLETLAPGSDVLFLDSSDNFDSFNACTLIGVTSTANHSNGFEASPFADPYFGLPVPSIVLGCSGMNNGNAVTVVSDDPDTLDMTALNNPFNNGDVLGALQVTSQTDVTFTWSVVGLPPQLTAVLSFAFS